jgi:UDP-N-acetylmuramoylalanine--D-glutamate ligase
MEVAGRRVVVVGLGASGKAAAALLRDRGARVTGVDTRTELSDPAGALRGVHLELGPHRRDTFLGAELVVVSPGVPDTQPDVCAAEAAGIPVVGELGLGVSLLQRDAPDLPVVAITGTNGKSTVTAFAGQLLRGAGLRCFVGGNLGDPLCGALPRQPGTPLDVDRVVLECSSYQLLRAGPLAPRAAAILNLTPDHLERHGTFEAYAEAKARILRHQGPGDVAFVPTGPPELRAAMEGVGAGRRRWIHGAPGLRVEGREALLDTDDGPVRLDLSGVPVPGAHNRENAALASALALSVGASLPAVREGLTRLEGLPHRMEVVHEADGVVWIDDSKATNVAAARVGVAGLDRPAVVLLGGQAKQGDRFAPLAPALARHRAVLAFGASGPAIARELAEAGIEVPVVATLREAVTRARALARPGDAVLLSPGGASFDAFDDFTHRGRCFRDQARQESP